MFKLIKLRKIILFFIFSFGFFTLISNSTFAQPKNEIFLENLPGLEQISEDNFKNDKAGQQLTNYVNWIIKTSVILGSMLAVGFIIYGGILYMTSEAFSGKSEGKEHLTNAIGGLIFLIGGYLIFTQINPNILNFNFSTASGRVNVSVGEIGITLVNGLSTDDEDNFISIRDHYRRLGYGEINCGGFFDNRWNKSEALKDCEERKVELNKTDNRKKSVCFIDEVGAVTSKYCFMIKLKNTNPNENIEEGYDELSTGYVSIDACNSERIKDKSGSPRGCFCNTTDDLSASCFYNKKSIATVKDEWRKYARELKRENPEMNTKNFEKTSDGLSMEFSDKADCESEKKQGKHKKTYGKCILKYTKNNLFMWGYFYGD